MTDAVAFSYSFSMEELKALATFFHPRQSNLPKELFAFSRSVQDKLYAALSIDEMENFYKK